MKLQEIGGLDRQSATVKKKSHKRTPKTKPEFRM